jgi:hypothetical protein
MYIYLLNKTMKKIKLKKIWITIILWLLSIIYIPNNIFAEDLNDLDIDWFYIIKEVEDIGKLDDAIKIVWATWWKVWETYNATASGLKTSEQIATWIMNWDTLMNYLVYIVQFTSQLWLVVWGWFIMYAWYKYMFSVFNWSQPPSSTVKNAIIWVIIVIFSYAIMKTLTSLIWIS